MSVECIGMIATQDRSETRPPAGPATDPAHVVKAARAHEAAGFDRILVAHNSHDADAILVASHAAAATSRIGFMIAHRPGFLQPTWAARQFATLDVFTGGRVAVHIITGGSPAEQKADGDFLDHEDRYRRTDEYVGLLRRIWTSEQPFDHACPYYRFENAFSGVKPLQQPRIPQFPADRIQDARGSGL